MELLINVLFGIILISGVMMTLIGLPGNLLIVIAGLAYGYYDSFIHVNYAVLIGISIAFLAGEGIEFIAGMLGAKKEKGSKRSMAAAFLGTVLGGIGGTFILPIIGSLIGALAGAFTAAALAEYTKENDKEQAKRVGISVVKGQVLAIAVKLTAALGMAVALLYQVQW